MKDTEFEQNSRAHSFWQEWQAKQGLSTDADQATMFQAALGKSEIDWSVKPDEYLDNLIIGLT